MISAGQTMFPCSASIAGAMAGIATASCMSAETASDMAHTMPASETASAYHQDVTLNSIPWHPTIGHLKSLAFDHAAERAALRYEEATSRTHGAVRAKAACVEETDLPNDNRTPSWRPIFTEQCLHRLHQLRDGAATLALASGLVFSGNSDEATFTHKPTLPYDVALETTLIEGTLQDITDGPEMIDALIRMTRQSIPVLRHMPHAMRKGYIVNTLRDTIIASVFGESKLPYLVAEDGTLKDSSPGAFHRSAVAIEEAFNAVSSMEEFSDLFPKD